MNNFSNNIRDDHELLTLLDRIESFFGKNKKSHIRISDEINKALFLAEELHNGQTRKSGEEYINHPLRVTIKLIDNFGENLSKKMLYKLIIVSILHDTIEDTQFKENDIDKHFGSCIAKAVKLLSKELWSIYIEEDNELEKVIYLKDLGLINEKLKLTEKGKSIKKLEDSEYKKLIEDFIIIEEKYKKIRNEHYFNKLVLLKKRRYDELEMGAFTAEEKDNIRNIVLPIKGIDRSDNLETMDKIISQKMVIKIKETVDELLPLLEDWPDIINILRTDIKNLIESRLIYINKLNN